MIPLFKVGMAEYAHADLKDVLYSGFVAQGDVVDRFEAALGRYLGVEPRAVVTVNSGTSALELALFLAGVRPGSEVITTPMTCAATTCAIVSRGARPVWADIDPLTGNIDPFDVERKITRRTRAIVAVDWGGRICDYGKLGAVSRDAVVVEDAAHVLGPHDDSVMRGDLICYSYQAIKYLTTGDGGALVLNNDFDSDAVAKTARNLRWFGVDRTQPEASRWMNDLPVPGWKFHMNNIAASIGLSNLPLAHANLLQQQDNAREYFEHLAPYCEVGPVGGVVPYKDLIVPRYDPLASYWIFTVLVHNRPQFVSYLAERGIACSAVHRRNDMHTGFDYPNGPLPGVDFFSSRNVAIPVGWWLTADERWRVIEAVLDWAKGKRS